MVDGKPHRSPLSVRKPSESQDSRHQCQLPVRIHGSWHQYAARQQWLAAGQRFMMPGHALSINAMADAERARNGKDQAYPPLNGILSAKRFPPAAMLKDDKAPRRFTRYIAISDFHGARR